ncbi:MAG: aminotransferase class IV [Sphingobacteriaceae bacterium]|nr:aminotransferase class IV [Cytophagaceae bacterium]
MSRFLETIRCHNGRLENLPYHQERVRRTRKAVLGLTDELDLGESLVIPPGIEPAQTFRCRVIYGLDIESVEFIPYQIRPLRSLKLVHVDGLDYAFKYADRSTLDALRAGLPADEEVLLVKAGLLTDTTYANIALFDGAYWYTPAQPLLEGTRRAQLLAEGRLIRERLAPDDLRYFQKIRLLNAMMSWEEGPELPTNQVV